MKVLMLLLFALPGSPAGSEQSWTPDSANIGRLEVTLQSRGIPARGFGKVRKLNAYNRYHAGYISGDEKMTEAELIASFGKRSKPTGIHILASRKELHACSMEDAASSTSFILW